MMIFFNKKLYLNYTARSIFDSKLIFMKKIIILIIFSNSIAASLLSQEVKPFGKYLEKSKPKKSYTDLNSTKKISTEDSTINKLNNGFDIKKSKVDNMNYLKTTDENIALKKMPIRASKTMALMPTKKLPALENRFFKDSTVTIKNKYDSLKKW